MVQAISTFEQGDKESCLRHLEAITIKLRHLLHVFYDNLRDARVPRSVWLSYVQGFQAWGVGRNIDGEYVKYDGLSGSHTLVFQAVDAFLGMERYLPDKDMVRYIPKKQRDLCAAFK